MDKTTNITPTEYADYLGEKYNKTISKGHKKTNAQYFSPVEVARYMASLINKNADHNVKILDPGSGSGVLSCALCEELCNLGVRSIELDLYEIDKNIFPYLENSMEYLERYITEKDVNIKINIINKDFILDNAVALINPDWSMDNQTFMLYL
ncbi:N-6 DNA methylase [Paludifilum halophilum]|uniref:DNA methylase adenine-specific domain-containing protein n=1 Tax=Paludifilum halophilum TaxID=1642702 RepID=A0A235B604_9BACL|nr:N-6 DNA methylase [Paludifilum halophilum]OYD07738.1 hypothetical protein CHM34_09715 [Paludifilum halophilum]